MINSTSIRFAVLKIHTSLVGETSKKAITPAPDWRLLNEYGGHMTIEHLEKHLIR